MAHLKENSTQAGCTSNIFRLISSYEITSERKEEEETNPLFDELWRACAGDWPDMPKVGQIVYYFPQGHIEQLEPRIKQQLNNEIPNLNIPSRILCRVTGVKKHVQNDIDEPYAEICLHPLTDQTEARNLEPEDDLPEPPRQAFGSFSKILTASDAMPHGGFSIPKKPATEYLPPLDMSQATPTQDLSAKDLQGYEWRFKHIYRGQPRRHMLTTGWGAFVTSKKVVAGDEIVFVRGDDGELRVGVRRRAAQQSIMASILISGQIIRLAHLASLPPPTHSVTTRTAISVYNKPRAIQFLVEISKYREANGRDAYHTGMRFKTCDDGSMGTIVGVGDYSPIWPGSEWLSIKVEWDRPATSTIGQNRDRVSPWEIQPLAAPSLLSIIPAQAIVRKKRSRPADVPARRSSIRARSVQADQHHQEEAALVLGSVLEVEKDSSTNGILMNPVAAAADDSNVSPDSAALFNNSTKASSSAAAPSGIVKDQMGGCRIFGVDLTSNAAAASSVTTQKQLTMTCPSVDSSANKEHHLAAANSYPLLGSINEASHVGNESGVVVYEQPLAREVQRSPRTRTKVHMQGAAFGRTVDLTALNGYEELRTVLEMMFGIRGQLSGTGKKWVLAFTDDEGDLMLVGDDPWLEFCKIVKNIVIYSSEDAKKLKGRFKLVMSPVEAEAGTSLASLDYPEQ